MPFLEHAGERIHYTAPHGLGEDGRRLLVLLHGFGGSARLFEPLVEALGSKVATLAFDMPGCGQSSGETLADVTGMARFVGAITSRVAPGRALTCLGHSFGGLVAAEVALTFPEQVESLVIIASSPRVRLHPEMQRQALSGDWNEAFQRGSFGPRATEAHVQLVLEGFRALRLPKGGDVLGQWQAHDITPRLAALHQPALVVVPKDDIIISPRNGDTWVRGMPNARRVDVEGVGHYVQLEDAPAVAQHVNAFLHLTHGEPS